MLQGVGHPPLLDATADAILAALPPGVDAVAVRDGPATVVAMGPGSVIRADGHEAFERLEALDGGWWAGYLAYDLGRAVERVPDRNPPDPGLPDLLLARFDARLVLLPGEPARIEGEGPARSALEQLLRRAAGSAAPPAGTTRLTGWRSSLDRDDYRDRVRNCLEHIVAGDCYQVNLTRRLETDAAPDPVALHRALVRGNPAPHAALVRIGDVAVVSASPERFLRRDGDLVQTRPIKGTGADPDALSASAKDRAENVMIVDLARNDLGRVCRYGSVRVPGLWVVEAHPGLHHLVSTVEGRLRPGVDIAELVRAIFPPASITGAPKPRVMEIIETLEPVRRGVYCGAVGFIDADRDVMDLNVAIRTFTVAGGRTSFGVGGGIVADSDPTAEWEETELKARRLLRIAEGSTA